MPVNDRSIIVNIINKNGNSFPNFSFHRSPSLPYYNKIFDNINNNMKKYNTSKNSIKYKNNKNIINKNEFTYNNNSSFKFNNNNNNMVGFKNVINLSSKNFDPFVFSLLNKGLKFSLAPNKTPTDDVICSIEYRIKDLPHNIKETIRQDCVVVLRKAKPPKKNLSKVKFLSLKTLRDDPDIVILKADNGGDVVILDKSGYFHKMVEHLSSSGSYNKLKKNLP